MISVPDFSAVNFIVELKLFVLIGNFTMFGIYDSVAGGIVFARQEGTPGGQAYSISRNDLKPCYDAEFDCQMLLPKKKWRNVLQL